MDPTAPNNNDPESPKSQPSPIQPGQFVTTEEEENGQFKQPPSPQPSPTSQPSASAPPPAPPPQAAPQPPLPTGTNLAGAVQEPPSPETGPAPQFENQPSPTPYVAPQTSGEPPPTGPSTIAKFRVILIVLGFLLLIALVAAVAWFFILKKVSSQEGTKTAGENRETVEVPTPPPARKSGGFSELPPATEEAEESTPESD